MEPNQSESLNMDNAVVDTKVMSNCEQKDIDIKQKVDESKEDITETSANKSAATIDKYLQRNDIIHMSLEDTINSEARLKYLKKIQYKYNALCSYVPGMNSLHKNSLDVSLVQIPLKEIKQACTDIIMQQFERDINKMRLYGGFVINYGDKYSSNKKLTKHKDDSSITINYCLKSECEGNEVLFYKTSRHRIPVVAKSGWVVIHDGDYVHETMPIESGLRWNIVLWFK
mmetsp:Transcript_323/g.271  ORF Transcript_323/g.271 Transcript_323/m.271 type:complete len:228 (-) Transcript_323:47-730(-)